MRHIRGEKAQDKDSPLTLNFAKNLEMLWNKPVKRLISQKNSIYLTKITRFVDLAVLANINRLVIAFS